MPRLPTSGLISDSTRRAKGAQSVALKLRITRMPSVVRHIWEFIVAVARQWSTIVTGGFIAALILLYEHKTGEPIAGRLFWIAVITSLVIAVFLAWRKERVTVESLTAPRPDFVYQGVGSQITFNVPTDPATTNKLIVQINFFLRFINKGQGTAYNLSSKIYACWINDVPRKAVLADSTQPVVGRTTPGEGKSLGFSAWRYVQEHSSLSIRVDARDVLLILVETRFRQGAEPDSSISENEPIWKTWDPRIPGRSALSRIQTLA
jgi:hypothetical protein